MNPAESATDSNQITENEDQISDQMNILQLEPSEGVTKEDAREDVELQPTADIDIGENGINDNASLDDEVSEKSLAEMRAIIRDASRPFEFDVQEIIVAFGPISPKELLEQAKEDYYDEHYEH